MLLAPQVLQDVETTTVSLVTLVTLVILDPKEFLEIKVSVELKVVQENVSVRLVWGGSDPLVQLVFQGLQVYLDVMDLRGTQE